MLDGIFQLSHVSRPGILQETVQARGIEPKIGQSKAGSTLAHKMSGQRKNVVLSLIQRRHVNLNNAQTVVQIFTETIGLDGLFQVAVGRRNHAHIDLDGTCLANAHDFSLLKNAE